MRHDAGSVADVTAVIYTIIYTQSRADGYGLESDFSVICGGCTKGAVPRVIEQQCATLRADSYHWSVLRCGSSSEGTRGS
jgi:hypothetical protein